MRVNQQSTTGTTDSFNSAPRSYRLVALAPSSGANQFSAQDTVKFSSSNQSSNQSANQSANPTVASLAAAAAAQSPARAAKVEALKQAVETGQYQLDSAKIAAAIANADV